MNIAFFAQKIKLHQVILEKETARSMSPDRFGKFGSPVVTAANGRGRNGGDGLCDNRATDDGRSRTIGRAVVAIPCGVSPVAADGRSDNRPCVVVPGRPTVEADTTTASAEQKCRSDRYQRALQERSSFHRSLQGKMFLIPSSIIPLFSNFA